MISVESYLGCIALDDATQASWSQGLSGQRLAANQRGWIQLPASGGDLETGAESHKSELF